MHMAWCTYLASTYLCYTELITSGESPAPSIFHTCMASMLTKSASMDPIYIPLKICLFASIAMIFLCWVMVIYNYHSHTPAGTLYPERMMSSWINLELPPVIGWSLGTWRKRTASFHLTKILCTVLVGLHLLTRRSSYLHYFKVQCSPTTTLMLVFKHTYQHYTAKTWTEW